MPARSPFPGPSLAAALASAAAQNSPDSHSAVPGAVAHISPARAAGNRPIRAVGSSPTKAAALAASASGAVGSKGPQSKPGSRPVTNVTQQATTAASAATALNPSLSCAAGGASAAVSRHEDASSSASFDSWHSRNQGDSATVASSAWPAAPTTAVDSSWGNPISNYPTAAAAADAQGRSVNTCCTAVLFRPQHCMLMVVSYTRYMQGMACFWDLSLQASLSMQHVWQGCNATL